VIAEIESDKITMEITAAEAGVLKAAYKEADSKVTPGEIIGLIDTSVAVQSASGENSQAAKAKVTTESEELSGKTPVDKAEKTTLEHEAQQRSSAAVSVTPEVEKRLPATPVVTGGHERLEERLPMSGLRKRIATRLKEAQNTAAMLTTFNEVNMQPVMDLRSKYKEAFQSKHRVGLGFMSFFINACSYASLKHPVINACIDGQDVIYHNYMDVGVAVSTEKGLVVPVLRDAGMMGFAQIESGIAELARKAREGGLMPDDLKGATFSITNGGVFGSLLSTPILNPPQSAILGMHAIQRRPVAEGEQVVIRPMMYLALTYDHRLIDGREAVQFLVDVKSYLENPGLVLLDL